MKLIAAGCRALLFGGVWFERSLFSTGKRSTKSHEAEFVLSCDFGDFVIVLVRAKKV